MPGFTFPLSFTAALAVAAGLVGLTLLAAHFLAPLGLLLAPVVLYQAVRPLMAAVRRGRVAATTLALLALTCLQDWALQAFAGGSTDAEGCGWLAVVTLGSGFGVFTQLIDLVTASRLPWPAKAFWLLLFPLGLALYLHYAPCSG